MLNITENIVELLELIPLCVATDRTMVRKRILAEVIIKAVADAIIVGGIVFFSTLASIGYQNINENIYTALLSSTVASGLSFFTELKKTEKRIWTHKES